jgi:hypothetical protein
VLFSSDEVSQFINENFEPAWESVRPVPVITIDFGNGHTITRTINGNIATHVCMSDGTLLDIIPGVYTADAYHRQLQQLVLLNRYVQDAPRAEARLADYHKQQAAHLAKNESPASLVEVREGPSILGVETTIRLVAAGRSNRAVDRAGRAAPPTPSAEKLPGWKELVEDTRINETLRRKRIHEKLAKAGMIQPKDITKWLYKEVLAADLDDPTLGLGDLLNKSYPFKDEDAKRK